LLSGRFRQDWGCGDELIRSWGSGGMGGGRSDLLKRRKRENTIGGVGMAKKGPGGKDKFMGTLLTGKERWPLKRKTVDIGNGGGKGRGVSNRKAEH